MKRISLNAQVWLGMCQAIPALSVIPAVAAAAEMPSADVRGLVSFDIKPQPIGTALNELAKRAGIQVLFFTDVANDITASELVGTYTPDEALKRLLANTGLTYSMVNERTVGIHRVGDTMGKNMLRNDAGSPLMHLAAVQTSEQQQDDQKAITRETSSGQRRSSRIEEVIVTAQRREQSIQDVPISIGVVTTEDISRRGLVSSEDYLRGIPGVSQEGRVQGQAIVIRGLETAPANQNYSAGTTVATYFGETPTTNTSGIGGDTNVDIKLVDIKRVEVLRGPQGTAFGNSSLGGAVRTIPMPPELNRLEGSVKAMVGSTSSAGGFDNMAQGVVNIPLVADKLALRAVAYRFENSGYYKNVAGSDPAFQAGTVAEHGAHDFATDDDHAGTQEFVGGRAAVVFQATDQWQFILNYLNQKTEMDGVGIAGLASTGGYTQAMYQVAPEHVRDGMTHGWVETDIRIANVTTEYDLGWAQLVASYSDTSSGTDYATPMNYYGVDWAGSGGLLSSHGEENAEVRLTTELKGPWDFLIGVYHEKVKDDYDFSWWYFGDPATNDICGPACFGVRHFGQQYRKDWLEQAAVFGEVTWEIVDDLTMTGGVRRYDFDRRIQIAFSEPLFGMGSITDDETDASGSNYRGNLSYKINPSTMVYASWAQGFRLGKPQPPLPPLCDRNNDGILDGTTSVTLASTGEVASDSVDSFELGTKVSLDRRLIISAAVFRVDWIDVPVRALAPGAALSSNEDGNGCGRAYTANAGEARSEGVEFQATWQISEPFRVDVGGSYIDAHLTKDAPGIGAHDGDRLPGSAKVNANLGLQYEFNVGGRDAYVRADSTYAGSYYNDFAQSPDLRAGGYTKVDASGGITFGSLNIELFVRNLTNRDDFTNRDVTPGLGPYYGYRLRPRSYSLQLGYSF